MKKTRYVIIFLLTIILLSGCSLSLTEKRVLSNEQWLEDIQTLDKELKEEHPNIFKYISEEEWNKSIESLKKDVDNLSDTDIIFRIAQIVTSIGDVHTMVNPAGYLKPIDQEELDLKNIIEFPIKCEYFDDGVRVTSCDSKYKDILGAKLLSINSIDIDKILNDVATLISNDYKNKQSSLYIAKELMNNYKILKFFEVVANNKAEFTFEKDNKEKITLKLKGVKNEKIDYIEAKHRIMKTNEVPKGENEFYWYKNFKEDNILYFRLNAFTSNHAIFETKEEENKYPDMHEIKERLLKEFQKHDFDKLIIDLRQNGGGHANTRDSIVDMIKFQKYLKGEDIYILTGKQSVSAAVTFTWELQKKLGSTVVGETTGGNVNLFSVGHTLELPNSKLNIFISSIERIRDKDYIGGVKPDFEVIQTYEDYINGVDTCYEYIKDLDGNNK